MPGEDQERFEDYLELERYIGELQAGRVAHPPAGLTAEQARIYHMAALFRSASPGAADPRPEFVGRLHAQLEQELQARHTSSPAQDRLEPAETAHPDSTQRPARKKSPVSRRSLLAGGAAVAASLALGAGIERVVDNSVHTVGPIASATPTSGLYPPPSIPLVGADIPSEWHFVTTLEQLGTHAFPFKTPALVGYIIYNNGDDGASDPDSGKVIAFSAACTHMGCIVQWQEADRKFHCPCHGGIFTEYGKVDTGLAPVRYLNALPRVDTKVEDGKIYVRIPASPR